MSTRQQPSILIVDDQRDAARTLRQAIEQSGRDTIVSDVPSGEEAQLELLRRPFDLLIIAEQLPGVPGTELLARVQKTRPEMAGIVLTNSPVEDVRAATADLNILWYFERPARIAEVVKVVNEALYGDAPPPQPETPAEEASAARPAPSPARDAAAGMLAALRADLGAYGAALIHTSGEMWSTDGLAASAPEFEQLAALLAENFARNDEIAKYLGGGAAFYHVSGARLELYAFSCGPETLIALLMPGGSSRQMGRVLHYGRSAAGRIAGQLYGKQPTVTADNPPAQEAAPQPVKDTAPLPPLVEEEEEAAPLRRTGSTDFLMNLAEPDAPQETIELDLDDLADDLDADIDNLDAYWEEAAALHTRVSEDALSFDEAIEMGLFPDDELEE